MNAIILAAGKATRLLPLTKDTPQSLLKVNNKTILERQIDSLRKVGVLDITVVTGHLSDQVETFCKHKGVKYIFNPFYDVSSMALSLWVVREELKNGFMFFYSDVLFDSLIIKNLLTQKGDICFSIKKDGLRDEAERVVEKNGLIECVAKSKIEEENGEFIGIAKFSKSGAKKLLAELNNAAKISLDTRLTRVIDNLITQGETVFAYDISENNFVDIDFSEDLKKAEKLFP